MKLLVHVRAQRSSQPVTLKISLNAAWRAKSLLQLRQMLDQKCASTLPPHALPPHSPVPQVSAAAAGSLLSAAEGSSSCTPRRPDALRPDQ